MSRFGRLSFIALVALSACAAPRTHPGSTGPRAAVRVQIDGGIVPVPLEDYVRTVILTELAPAAGDPRAIERMFDVQAIVSRTYAMASRHSGAGFDFCATTHCQLYDPARAAASRWSGAAAAAVRRTAGAIVRFGGVPARVVFHADCGGRTSAARDVWSGDDPSYLTSVDDGGRVDRAHAQWQFAPARAELIAALNADRRTRVGGWLDRIDVIRRDAGGRAQLVTLAGEHAPIVRGEELRSVLAGAFGARALRSTHFDVVRTERGFQFTGRGFGHGVGLCQAGAFARLAAGATPEEVLATYFPGTSLR